MSDGHPYSDALPRSLALDALGADVKIGTPQEFVQSGQSLRGGMHRIGGLQHARAG